ncbi:MAG: porin family protein [Alphaproteobacteria bacterium]|nr:porin family protein [Alphaproteobacteria bacterium]
MKKFLLLSGAAMLFSANAQAMNHTNWSEIKPYIGAEYVYSKAKLGGSAGGMKDNFNSAKGDLGMELYHNMYAEFSYQQSWQVKNKYASPEGQSVKQRFAAYAMDLYGKFPIMCSNLGFLLTGGAAIYDVKQKNLPDDSFMRVGYRAGAGLQYDFNNHWSARAIGRYSYVGAERLNNFKEVAVGMLYRF